MHDLELWQGKTLHYRGEDFSIRWVRPIDGQIKAEVEPPQQTVSDTLARIVQQSLDGGRSLQLTDVQQELDLM